MRLIITKEQVLFDFLNFPLCNEKITQSVFDKADG